MGQKLPPREAELYRRCDEVLHYMWDPIGVAGAPGARDEYHDYLPQVFARVRDGAEPADVVEFLVAVEEQSMGLPGNDARARVIVDVLRQWWQWIQEHGV